MSKVYDCSDDTEREVGITAAENAVRAGRLVVLPTDTVYGLGCDAFDRAAVAALLNAKHRGPDMPVPVLVGSWQTIDGLVAAVTPQMKALIKAFWPGGLSLVVTEAPSLPWDLGDANGSVMVRMPLHPTALELLRRTGPMAVSSANISGQAPATNVISAKQQLGAEASVYLDGGEADLGVASTILDLTVQPPRILREGAISAERLQEVLGVPVDTLRRPRESA